MGRISQGRLLAGEGYDDCLDTVTLIWYTVNGSYRYFSKVVLVDD